MDKFLELLCLAPAFDALHYRWETFQNGFSEKSIYRGQPTPELEAAWNDSIPEHPIVVSPNHITGWRDTADWSPIKHVNGEILTRLEVFRNLACLNLLRQHTYRTDYDYSMLRAFQGSEAQIMQRVDTCAQRLRKALMCAGDATPYLIMLTPEKAQKESPDFNTLHYCRDFDGVLAWTREHEVVGLGAGLPDLYE